MSGFKPHHNHTWESINWNNSDKYNNNVNTASKIFLDDVKNNQR